MSSGSYSVAWYNTVNRNPCATATTVSAHMFEVDSCGVPTRRIQNVCGRGNSTCYQYDQQSNSWSITPCVKCPGQETSTLSTVDAQGQRRQYCVCKYQQ